MRGVIFRCFGRLAVFPDPMFDYLPPVYLREVSLCVSTLSIVAPTPI